MKPPGQVVYKSWSFCITKGIEMEIIDEFHVINSNKDESSLNQELVKLEISLILEDYKSQIKSIETEIQNQQNVFSLIITAIGITIGASPFIFQYKVPLLFGVTSLVFYGLSLTQLRYIWAVLAIDKYIINTIIPDIKNAINKFDNEKEYEIDIFKWSNNGQNYAYTSKLWQFPIEAARYLIPVVAGICCCLAFWFTSAHNFPLIDYSIIALNIFWVFYIIIVSLKIRSGFLREKRIMAGKPRNV